MWSNFSLEDRYTEEAIDKLRPVPWAQPLLKKLRQRGDDQPSKRAILFEVRYAYELHQAGVIPYYEYPSGVGESSIDFHFHTGDLEWFIEIMSISKSDAAKRATRQIGPLTCQILPSINTPASSLFHALEEKQSVEAETVRVTEKLEHKAANKFPKPKKGNIHLLLVDVRGYRLQGGDGWDYLQMAYGPEFHIRDDLPFYSLKNGEPVKGLFDKANSRELARVIQERVHFLVFVCEKDYRKGEIREVSYRCPNPHLFPDDDTVKRVWQFYPLRRKSAEKP